MPKCEHCGIEPILPFTCAYCGKNYCVEHRLPENHNCSRLQKVPPHYLPLNNSIGSSGKPTTIEETQPVGQATRHTQFSLIKIITILAIVIVAGVIIWSSYPNLIQSIQNPSVSPIPSATPYLPNETPLSTSSENHNQEELLNYALSLINSDRQSKGLQNVTLSNIDSGQRHAESMLNFGFFSHWDTDGYKPYMRYTLAGGKGAVAENIGWVGEWSYTLSIKEALNLSEWNMMYDDEKWNWGHRDNILDPFHNKVSIGIAYDNNDLYFVQDFEDDYVSWSILSLSNQVVMQGTVLTAGKSISQVAIYFDNPTPLTTQQLNIAPYDGGYDAGTYVGIVVSPPPSGSQYLQPEKGILIIANTWSEAAQNFSMSFDLSTAFVQFGRGVYTLYLWTDSNNCLTSLSIWN